ncbi:MAG: metallophosphoesterase [Bacteroidales bacterium]|nr:metallophosphoesterase [Bacteroidales bacterium]
MKKESILFIVLLILIIIVWRCIEYSPYEVRPESDERDLNIRNIQKINQIPQNDTFIFVFAGDAQHHYDEASDFVDKVNSDTTVDFVCFAGDLTDFGLQFEYSKMNGIINDLAVPYVAVVGNHDLLYNGAEIYDEMFGELDFFFDLYGFRFVFVNTNSREYGFDGKVPNIVWMNSVLNDTTNYERAIIVMHVPPEDDDFDSNVEQEFVNAIHFSGKTILVLNGHRHYFTSGYLYDGSIHYLNSFALDECKYLKIKIWEGDDIDRSHSYEIVDF